MTNNDLYQNYLELNNNEHAKINIKIGETISNIFRNLFDLEDALFKETPQNAERKITVAIPKLILILASITAKYVFNKKA